MMSHNVYVYVYVWIGLDPGEVIGLYKRVLDVAPTCTSAQLRKQVFHLSLSLLFLSLSHC